MAIKFYAHRRGVDWSLLHREVEKLVFLSADRYVVQLLEVGWDAEPPYYVMEYVENGSLDDLLAQHGTFTVPEAVEMFREIAVGLAHAHGKGVLHCDLKPANILLDQDHRPRLADFGQSRLSHEQKPALGTLFYMAPEQADLEAVPDVRWDVYALGAILYYAARRRAAAPQRRDGGPDRLGRATWPTGWPAIGTRSAPPRRRPSTAACPAWTGPWPRSSTAAWPSTRTTALPTCRKCSTPWPPATATARRLPLMVLGFVGPLLVLLVTAFFS